METAPMTVVETPFFLRQVAGLLSEGERELLVFFLGLNPDAGEVVAESSGVRKLRWAVRGRGNAVAFAIYYFHSEVFPLCRGC